MVVAQEIEVRRDIKDNVDQIYKYWFWVSAGVTLEECISLF